MNDWVREWQERDGFGIPVFSDKDGEVVLLTKWYPVTLITPELIKWEDAMIRRAKDLVTIKTVAEEAIYRVVREDSLYIGMELVDVLRRMST